MIAAFSWSLRKRTERFIGRLPRWIAYPLMFIVSVLFWSTVAMVLLGCGGTERVAPQSPNHGYGFEYDLTVADGTRLRNAPGLMTLTQEQMESQIAEPYRDVERCAEIVTGGPLVVIVSDLGPRWGQTYLHDDPLVLIVPQGIEDDRVLRHEFVHYLLAVSGLPAEQNRCHRSPLFLACAGYEPETC